MRGLERKSWAQVFLGQVAGKCGCLHMRVQMKMAIIPRHFSLYGYKLAIFK